MLEVMSLFSLTSRAAFLGVKLTLTDVKLPTCEGTKLARGRISIEKGKLVKGAGCSPLSSLFS